MKTYDVKCPVCGHVNHNLFLEERDGRMECEKCKQITGSPSFVKTIKIPVYSMANHNKPVVVG